MTARHWWAKREKSSRRPKAACSTGRPSLARLSIASNLEVEVVVEISAVGHRKVQSMLRCRSPETT